MPSLLQRALKVSVRLRPQRPPSATGSDDGISPDERRALAAEIDRLFTDRSLIREGPPSSAHRNGVVLPILINLAALALLAGGIMLAHPLRATGPRVAPPETGNFKTAEGLIVQRVREQATEQLNAREQRISAIEGELARLSTSARGESAAQATDAQARRGQLERELAALKEAESSRLAAASGRLTDLAAARRQELFLVRQLQAIYQTTQSELAAGRLNEALDGVAAADRVLALASADRSGQMPPLLPALQAGDTVLRIAILYGQEITRASGAAAQTAARLKELEGTVAALQATLKDRNQILLRDQARLDAQEATIQRQSRLIAEQGAAVAQRDRELAAVISSLQGGIRRLRSDLLTSAGDSRPAAGPANSQESGLVDLLSTKVALREAVSSKEVRNAHPGLYSSLDRFFQQYGEVYAQQGRLQALTQIDAALNEVVTTIATRAGLHRTPPAAAPARGKAAGPLASSIEPAESYLAELDTLLGSMLRKTN